MDNFRLWLSVSAFLSGILYTIFAFIGCMTTLSFDYIMITDWLEPVRLLYSVLVVCILYYVSDTMNE
jgi:hypothetical protein